MTCRAPALTRRLPAVALLALGSCFSIGPLCGLPEPPCALSACASIRALTVATSSVSFTDECPGDRCPVVAERGSVGFAPAFHPAERALVIEGASVAMIRVDSFAPADGAAVSANVRCEPGGQLRWLGDDRSPLMVTVPTEWNWTAFSLLIRRPVINFTAEAAALERLTTTHVRFENFGSAPCLVGRLRYDTLANVCVSRVCLDVDASRADASAGADVFADRRGDGGETSARDSEVHREDALADRQDAMDADGDDGDASIDGGGIDGAANE